MSHKRYLIFRVYTKDERPNPNERDVLYGWTSKKSVLKAFLAERDNKKYFVRRISEEDIKNMFDENVDDTDIMIDCVKLQSAQTNEEFTLFTTMNEMHQAEIDIQKYFRKLCSFDSIEGDGEYVKMITHLDEFFASALFYLGYRPQDIDDMYPSADEMDNFSGAEAIERDIDFAYGSASQYPVEEYGSIGKPLGLDALSDVSSKIIYSLENFIKVLREDL